jgi:hypothetical protein
VRLHSHNDLSAHASILLTGVVDATVTPGSMEHVLARLTDEAERSLAAQHSSISTTTI